MGCEDLGREAFTWNLFPESHSEMASSSVEFSPNSNELTFRIRNEYTVYTPVFTRTSNEKEKQNSDVCSCSSEESRENRHYYHAERYRSGEGVRYRAPVMPGTASPMPPGMYRSVYPGEQRGGLMQIYPLSMQFTGSKRSADFWKIRIDLWDDDVKKDKMR